MSWRTLILTVALAITAACVHAAAARAITRAQSRQHLCALLEFRTQSVGHRPL
jgi:hypothetical protein